VRCQALVVLKQILVADKMAPPSPHPSSSSSTTIVVDPCPSEAVEAYQCWWQCCLDEVLFPILRRLGEDQDQEDGDAYSRSQLTEDVDEVGGVVTKLRTMGINTLSKIFLRHLPELVVSEQVFHTTWVNVLEIMKQYTISAGPNGALTVAVQEALKNMLLVMSASGVFNPSSNGGKSNSRELWDLTWSVIDPFAPTLKSEVFPTAEGGHGGYGGEVSTTEDVSASVSVSVTGESDGAGK